MQLDTDDEDDDQDFVKDSSIEKTDQRFQASTGKRNRDSDLINSYTEKFSYDVEDIVLVDVDDNNENSNCSNSDEKWCESFKKKNDVGTAAFHRKEPSFEDKIGRAHV